MITIKNALNGWILELRSNDEEIDRYVFSYEDNLGEYDEVQAFALLLRKINDLIGPSTSRYSEYRIYLDIRPGDKYSVIKQEED